MKKIFILSFVFPVIFSAPPCMPAAAQRAAAKPAAPEKQAPAAQMPSDMAPAPVPAQSSAGAGQAPDDATKKISELVHAGNYADAQQLTNGLLVAYPNDQRLIKAQALIARLMANGGSATGNVQPAASAADASTQLTGMDKVDYSALIALARQAQEEMDKTEQDKLLRQFMVQSSVFLERHPEQMLLWQLRAASAMSLNDARAGYDAGQKLIGLGAADSNDPNVQQLLGQLKNKGWMDLREVQKQSQSDWLVGLWNGHSDWTNKKGRNLLHGDFYERFVKTSEGFEGHGWDVGKEETQTSNFKIAVLDSGDIDVSVMRNSGWVPAAHEVSSDKRNLKITFTIKYTWTCGAFSSTCAEDRTYTGVFTKQ